MAVGRQDFPNWPAATLEGPRKEAIKDLSKGSGDVTPAACLPLYGPIGEQEVYVGLKTDTQRSIGLVMVRPSEYVDYAALARACPRYKLRDLMVVDVDRRLQLAGLPDWAVALAENVSDEQKLITPFSAVKVYGRYRGISLVATCTMPAPDQIPTCTQPIVKLVNAQVDKLAAV